MFTLIFLTLLAQEPKQTPRPDGLGYCYSACTCGCVQGKPCRCDNRQHPYRPGEFPDNAVPTQKPKAEPKVWITGTVVRFQLSGDLGTKPKAVPLTWEMTIRSYGGRPEGTVVRVSAAATVTLNGKPSSLVQLLNDYVAGHVVYVSVAPNADGMVTTVRAQRLLRR